MWWFLLCSHLTHLDCEGDGCLRELLWIFLNAIRHWFQLQLWFQMLFLRWGRLAKPLRPDAHQLIRKMFLSLWKIENKSATEWFSQAQSPVSFHGVSFQLHHFFFYLNIVFKDHGDILTLTYLDFEDSTYHTEFTFLFLLSNSRLIIRRKG